MPWAQSHSSLQARQGFAIREIHAPCPMLITSHHITSASSLALSVGPSGRPRRRPLFFGGFFSFSFFFFSCFVFAQVRIVAREYLGLHPDPDQSPSGPRLPFPRTLHRSQLNTQRAPAPPTVCLQRSRPPSQQACYPALLQEPGLPNNRSETDTQLQVNEVDLFASFLTPPLL